MVAVLRTTGADFASDCRISFSEMALTFTAIVALIKINAPKLES